MITKIRTKYLLLFIVWMWALVAFGQDTTIVNNTTIIQDTTLTPAKFSFPTYRTEIYSIVPDDTLDVFDTPGLSVWKTSDSVTILHQFTFDPTGVELEHNKMTIIDVSYEYIATTYTIKDVDDNYVVSFWHDGSMVAYTFRNAYILITGNIAY